MTFNLAIYMFDQSDLVISHKYPEMRGKFICNFISRNFMIKKKLITSYCYYM